MADRKLTDEEKKAVLKKICDGPPVGSLRYPGEPPMGPIPANPFLGVWPILPSPEELRAERAREMVRRDQEFIARLNIPTDPSKIVHITGI